MRVNLLKKKQIAKESILVKSRRLHHCDCSSFTKTPRTEQNVPVINTLLLATLIYVIILASAPDIIYRRNYCSQHYSTYLLPLYRCLIKLLVIKQLSQFCLLHTFFYIF